MAIREVLTKIGGPRADKRSIAQGFSESPVPPPMTDPERFAALDEEEALFRVYWRTLPDKALARRTWPSEVRWYCGQKDLDGWVEEELVRRCEDLREKAS